LFSLIGFPHAFPQTPALIAGVLALGGIAGDLRLIIIATYIVNASDAAAFGHFGFRPSHIGNVSMGCGEGNLMSLANTGADQVTLSQRDTRPLNLGDERIEHNPSQGLHVALGRSTDWVSLLKRTNSLNRSNIGKALNYCSDPVERRELLAEMDRLNAKYPATARFGALKPADEKSKVSVQDRHPILQLIVSRMPAKPYFADDLSRGTKIRDRDKALQHLEIQVNRPWSRQCLVFDIDHSDPLNGELPQPNVVVTNSVTGHRHVAVVLDTPVIVGPNASRKAQNFYSDLARAVGQCWQADPRYAGVLMHNPLHQHWQVEILHDEPYQLSDFRNALEIVRDMPANHPRHAGTAWADYYASLGRNCRTWELCRWPAYTWGRSATFDRVLDLVAGYNASHNTPSLSYVECRQIARSISRYVMSGRMKGGMVPEDWREWVSWTHRPEVQARRQKASVEARLAASADQRVAARIMQANGGSYRKIAEILGVSAGSVHRWCATKN
jgi:hypothetical protein